MGWKNVKEHYRITHYVQVTDAGICIGSPYIHDIIVIGLDGNIKKRDSSTVNAALVRYQKEMTANPEKLKELVLSPDSFTESITVYTYDGSKIIEKACEASGWPNVTHDGQMMYENTFSTNRAQVVRWALRNEQAHVSLLEDRVAELRSDLAEREASLAQAKVDVEILSSLSTFLSRNSNDAT